MFYEIKEKEIKKSAEEMNDDKDNIYYSLLATADIYKEASLTPVYIYREDTHQICVVCREIFTNTLH
jgi:hypothetical protein